MLRRWRRTIWRRRARLKVKQQPMTPSSSPVHDVLEKEDCPDSTTIPGHHKPQQPEIDDELEQAVAELEGLSLTTDTFARCKSDIFEAVGDEEEDDTDEGPRPPASPLDDPGEGSQTSNEESWASFPSSRSCSIDSSFSADEHDEGELEPGAVDANAPLPSPEATFKFHEEFSSGDVDDNDGSEPPPPPPEEEEEGELAMDEDEEDLSYAATGPWSSSAVPRWAFLRSSNSLPLLGLGPRDFYHGGSTLRHEVSADEVEDEDEDEDEGSDEDAESGGSQEIAIVGVVHL